MLRMLIALYFVIIMAPFTAGAASMSAKQLIHNYDLIAFGNEYTGKRYDYVRKWAEPIRVGLQGKFPAYFEEFVVDHINNLRKLTGHPIELYYSITLQKQKKLPKDFDAKKVNFILFYLPVEQIPGAVAKYFDHDEAAVKKMIEVSTCFAKFGTRKNEIRWAISVFPSHRPKDHMRACVVEELTQVLGLPNDSTEVTNSIFNDKSRYFELTGQDKLMLKMLYDPRVTFGMPRQQALDIGMDVLRTHAGQKSKPK